MKKTNCIVSLCIGLLSLNTLSSCTNKRQEMGGNRLKKTFLQVFLTGSDILYNLNTEARYIHTITPLASNQTKENDTTLNLHNLPMTKVFKVTKLNAYKCNNPWINTDIQKRIHSGVNVDTKLGPYGITRLMDASANGCIERIRFLIRNKADLNVQDSSGRTALMYAVINNKPDAVELLINNKADINMKDKQGKTALMHAESNNRIDIFKLLIASRAKNASNIYSECNKMRTSNYMNNVGYDRKEENREKQKVIGEALIKPVLFEGGLFVFDPFLIEDFNPARSVATCYIVCNRKILLLKKNDLSTEGNTWCMPGGKLEQNETPLQAVIREAKEETGILLLPEEINLTQTIYVRILTPKQDYILHLFKTVLHRSQSSDYTVMLSQEHTDYLWVNPVEAQQLNLLPGGKEILESHLSRGMI